jgi:hypothetical protein
LYIRVAAKSYQFEPETHTLVLPGGERLAAADLKEVDKRKWHKFYVTLNMNDGRSHTLDLYRHDPLEEWVLEMEKAAFPESVSDEETRNGAPEGAEPAEPISKNTGSVSAMTYGGLKDGVFGMFVFQADPIRAAGKEPGAYAQGEVLKSLGVALRDEGGWRQWLTAAGGMVRESDAATVVNWLAEREATFKSAFSRLDEPMVARAVSGEGALEGEWYVVVIGRLSEEAARRAYEALIDPPSVGFAAFSALRVNPPTIDRFLESVAFEPGMEIKGEMLVGRWAAVGEDVETSGLKAL